MFPKNSYHFSIDDVFDALIEVSDKKISPEDHPFFRFLIELHNSYMLNIDLYVFYQKMINDKERTLKEVSSNFKSWFVKNPWLRLGPHALDDRLAPYQQTKSGQIKTFDSIYRELERFSGNLSCFIRLHYFSESFELSKYFKKLGVQAIFTTDKKAITYRMPNEIKEKLKKKGFSNFNCLIFIRSHLRVENLANKELKFLAIEELIKRTINRYGFLIFFTHEYELRREDIRKYVKTILNILIKKGTSSI